MAQKYKSEFTFKLIKPIPYHDGGNSEAIAKELILKAPSNRQRRQTAKLKQGFFRALNDIQNSKQDSGESSDNAEEISGEAVLTIIMMSKVDFADYQDVFRELLLNDIAFITDNQKLKSHNYDEISDTDSDKLMGEYIANFLLSSWMSKLMSK